MSYWKWILAFVFSASLFAEEPCNFLEEECKRCAEKEPADENFEQLVPSVSRYSENTWMVHKYFALGYRYDSQTFKNYYSNNSKLVNSESRIQPRNTIVFLSGAGIRWKNLILAARGGYGWLGSGQVHYSSELNHYNEPFNFPSFELGAGYTADAQVQAGWRLRLYNRQAIGFNFTPSVGYQYSHIMNFPKRVNRQEVPNPPATLPYGTNGAMYGSFPTPSQQDWYGPYFELKTMLRFEDFIEWSVFYQYHWPSLRIVNNFELNNYFSTLSGTAIAAHLYSYHSVTKANYAHMQLGGTDIKVQTEQGWSVGLHIEGFGFNHKNCTTDVNRQKQESILTSAGSGSANYSEKTEVSWSQFLSYFYTGYRF